MRSRYSTVLTVILVILIILIIAIATVMGIRVYKNYTDEKETDKVIAKFTESQRTNTTKNKNTADDIDNTEITAPIHGENTTNSTTEGEQTPSRPTVPLYNNYPMIGTIKIKKIGVEYPILIDTSPGALDTAVGVMYPVNPKLNEKGNVVIIGHNYRNGKFFSKNKKLITGDKIEITDLQGRTLTYTIYEIFETTPNDTEYITRERGENIEISLSTCTDDGDGRLVILAKVE